MKLILLLVGCFFYMHSFAQKEKSPYEKFGKVTVSDLEKKVYSIDSSANAVVLSDIGTRTIEGNSKSWFSIITKRHTVIHILNKNAYDEANVEIPLYGMGSDAEKVSNLKGVTYNLENGKMVTTKLEKSGQFVEKVDKNRQIVKFTLPQVKEGSIIEYEYQVTSDYISVPDPWYFQSITAPTLWSECNFSVPEFFFYNYLNRGYQKIDVISKEDRRQTFNVSEYRSGYGSDRQSFDAGVTDHRWVIKNAPELKTENYTFSIRNHISRMEFQLISQGYPLTQRTYRSTWEEITKNLLLSPSFGEKLDANNNWMSDEVKPLYVHETSTVDKAKKIYDYVRDHFKSTGNYGIYLENSLKDIFKTKKGSSAEINLLLTAMLRYAGLTADPVVLSTTGNGYSFEYLPMLTSMNYVVVQVLDGNNTYYLDASKPRLGFNTLPVYCYNGHARIVNQNALPLYLSPDSIKEEKHTVFFISNASKGKWVGTVTQDLGTYDSYEIRNEISEKGQEDFFKGLQKYYLTSKIMNPKIDSLNNFEAPLQLKYELDFNPNEDDILYVNPTFGEGYSKNPFANANRSYPVEMPYKQEEVIIATIEIPEGYVVDELPKQMKVSLDETGTSFFEYRISKSGGTISFLNRIKINKSFFGPEEYPVLREFFNLVVKKQSEQIVFKKKG